MKISKKGYARLRIGIYGVSSAALKVAGLYGLVDGNESEALLLLVSAVLDLALFNVDLSGESESV